MGISASKLRKLEAKIKKRNQKYSSNQNENIIIPDNWIDFAKMTKIRSGGDIKTFNPYLYQEKLVQIMLERSVIVTKSRQLGISETITCYMLWQACKNPGYLGLVFSKTQTDSSLLARRMKRMIASLNLKTTTENLSDIEIEGKGRILFRNSKPDSARGIESVVDAFFDEFAFLESGKEIFDAVAPAQQMVGDKARVFIVSTPNGKAGFYWDLLNSSNGNIDIELMCNQVSKGNEKPFQYWIDTGDWAKVLIHWRCHPIYGKNPNFLEEIHQKQKLSWTTINQEYNLSFQESEANFFSADIIRQCSIGKYEDVERKTSYIVGIDAATTGEDYAVGTVLKIVDEKISLVHLYRKRKETTQYHLFQLGEIINNYKPVVVAVEVTGGSGQIWLEQLTKSYRFIKFKAIRTTSDSKPVMLDRFKLLLEQGKFLYPQNSPLVDELLSFKRVGKKLQATQGKHDDVIMSACFALSAMEELCI